MKAKTIVITGASSGIGRAAADACLAAGYRVIATARAPGDLDRLAAIGAVPVPLELTSSQSIAQAAALVRGASGGVVDVLFNNAGYGLQVALEDATPEALRRQLETNVIGPITLTNALLDTLRPGAKLVFNSSVLGVCVVPFRGPYCMSKFAVEAASDAYRLELASRGIGVHVIQPGPIEAQFRPNALRALEECLGDRTPRLDYGNHLQRLRAVASTEGSLPAAAVAQVFLDIVEGRRTRPRYLVTRLARMAAYAKRALGSGFDRLARASEPVVERR